MREGMQVELPDELLQRAVDANRAYLRLFADGPDITPGPYTYHRFWFRDAAFQLAALDRWGFHREAEEILRSFPGRQRADGFFYSQWREWDSNGAAIWAVAEHHRIRGNDELLREVAPSVRRGAQWIRRTCRERPRDRPEVQGLFPAGVSAEHLGPHDFYYWDDFWGLRGLIDAAYILRATGDEKGAAEAEAAGEELRRALFLSLNLAAERVGARLIPAGPTRGIDAAMIGSLVACYPLRLLEADDPWIAGTANAIREHFCLGDAFFQGISHTGLGTYLTLQLAFVELEAGQRRAWDRLAWLLGAATPTFTWPEAIHPRLGGGCMGDGHHGWAAADFLSFVRNTLVREAPDGSITLFTIIPPGWEGKPVKVEHAPTQQGLISFELTWKGPNALLAWECEKPGVTLRATGLDPQWRSNEQSGQAILARDRLDAASLESEDLKPLRP